jgi:hypothetical protein
MSNNVFANGREISCKKADGKSICAFPDVCFTPPDKVPPTPIGVPIPYPNTGMSTDTTSGSKKVKISGQEINLKNKSYFKKSTGDEAGCAQKKGIITSVNRGKVYFTMWSMDVKVEGENVVRHLDLTTHNHASMPGNSPPWPYIDSAAFEGIGPCADLAKKLEENCADKAVTNSKGRVTSRTRKQTMDAMCDKGKCEETLKCVLTKKRPNNCCPDKNGKKPTPHHVVPASQFNDANGNALSFKSGRRYSYYKAPCICAEGNSHSVGKHGEIHGETNTRTRAFLGVPPGKAIPDQRWPVTFSERIGAEAVEAATGCPKACTQAQVRAGHEAMGVGRSDKVRPTYAGGEAKSGNVIVLPG